MKNLILKCLTAALVMMCLMFTTVYANPDFEDTGEKTNLELIRGEMQSGEFAELLAVYVQDTEANGYTRGELLDSYLGELYQIPELTKDNEIIYNDNIWHCPIIRSKTVMADIDFVIKNGKVFCSVSAAYTDEINEYIGKNRVMFFSEDKFICMDAESSVFSARDDVENAIVVHNFSQTDCSEDKKVSTILGIGEEAAVPMYDVGPCVLPNYPICEQGGDPICWAATIASMVKYKFPSQYAGIKAEHVCAAVNHNAGATWDIMMTAMNYYFKSPYVPTAINASLTRQQIQTVINNNDPALMDSVTDDGSSAHATALIGYQITSGSLRVKMMNPATGKEQWTYYDPTDKVVYSMSTGVYTWIATIRLMYH